MKYQKVISELEELLMDDLLTGKQKDDIRSTLKALRSHQVLSEGEDGGAEHKLDRIVAKLRKRKTDLRPDSASEAQRQSEYKQGLVVGISKALSIVLGEMEDE